jgi:broad specificity phosphatase PhoE
MREDTEESEWPLTERGWQQAAATGAWIQERYGRDFEAAISSPFLRARQTAEGLGLGLTWRTDERIREREWGDYAAEGFGPYTVEEYLRDLAECSRFNWRTPFPGAERLADLVPRCRAFVQDLLANLNGGRAIVVSHGGTLRAIQMVLERLPEGEDARLPHTPMTNGTVLMYRLTLEDLDRSRWTGEAKQAHPGVGGLPEGDWRALVGR